MSGSMPRFFVTPEDVCGEEIFIRGGDAQHIGRVLRMRTGEKLTVCDMNGRDYFCSVSDITSDCVTLAIESSAPTVSEPTVRVVLYVALSKGDKLDHIVQKSVELGVSEVRLFTSTYCVVKWDGKDSVKKTERNGESAEPELFTRNITVNIHNAPPSFRQFIYYTTILIKSQVKTII